MLALELACTGIVALYLGLRVRAAADRRAVAARLALLALAGFLAEDSAIRAYGYYRYDPRWDLFVDQVPLLIALIWPVVIDSAWRLAERLSPRPGLVPWVVFAVVLTDASLIEPVCVHAGLWAWVAPGIFGAPPIGILGWGLFAASAVALGRRSPWAMLAAAVPLHLGLLAGWWAVFRWLPGPVSPLAAVAGAWLAMGLCAGLVWRRRVPPVLVWMRAPGAAFFFAVLAATEPRPLALFAYAAAFVPPYLLLTLRADRQRAA